MFENSVWPILRDTAVWWSPVVAGFIGAFGVHLLTQSRDREKWILDSKRQEYRELLDALSQSHMTTKSAPAGYAAFSVDPKQHLSIVQVQDNTIRVFSDRIFIIDDLELRRLQTAWRDATTAYASSPKWALGGPNSIEIFDDEYNRIKDEIVVAANRSVPKTFRQRLMFWKD